MNTVEDILNKLKTSKFRSKFYLTGADKLYIQQKGLETIKSHAQDFIKKRLSPAVILNDGKQTPFRGHPVFTAQHATATCCRECLEKWHKIKKGKQLSELEQDYIVSVILTWIQKNM